MHDASKVQMGGVGSSIRISEVFDSDPASFPAGVAVSLSSTGALSLLKSAGMRIGISLGKSLSDSKKTVVVFKGREVPILATLKRASAMVTITSYANLVSGSADKITVGETAFTAQAGAATPGEGTFQAASSNEATATSLAAQINAHADTKDLVKAVASGAEVTVYALTPGADGNAIAISYENNDENEGLTITGASEEDTLDGGSDDVSAIDYLVPGQKVYINDTTGRADVAVSGISTISDAVYSDRGPLTGISEAGAEVPAAAVHLIGGL